MVLGNATRWFFGILFGTSAIAVFLTGQVFPGILWIFTTVIALPPTAKFLEQRMKWGMAPWQKFVLAAASCLAGLGNLTQPPGTESSNKPKFDPPPAVVRDTVCVRDTIVKEVKNNPRPAKKPRKKVLSPKPAEVNTLTPQVYSPLEAKPKPKKESRSTCSYNGRTLHVGPRGGCYYINSNGNKTYVDRSYCANCY